MPGSTRNWTTPQTQILGILRSGGCGVMGTADSQRKLTFGPIYPSWHFLYVDDIVCNTAVTRATTPTISVQIPLRATHCNWVTAGTCAKLYTFRSQSTSCSLTLDGLSRSAGLACQCLDPSWCGPNYAHHPHSTWTDYHQHAGRCQCATSRSTLLEKDARATAFV